MPVLWRVQELRQGTQQDSKRNCTRVVRHMHERGVDSELHESGSCMLLVASITV